MSEAVPRREATLRFLDFIGNNERKLGFAAIILSEPGNAHTAKSVRTDYNDRQDGAQGWPVKSVQDMEDVIENSFVQSGLLVKDRTDTYRVNEDLYELYASLNGFLAYWSNHNSEVSSQEMLGRTASSGAVRSPRARFQIYEYLLEHTYARINQISKIFPQIGYKTADGVARQIEVMTDAGLVDIEAITLSGLFVRIDGMSPQNRSALPEVEALRGMIQTFPEGIELDLDDIMSDFKTYYPSNDKVYATLHNMALRYLKAYKYYLGMTLIDPLPGSASRVRLAEEIEKPVQTLYTGIQNHVTNGSNEKDTAYMTSLVQESDSREFRDLIAKGRLFSPQAGGKNREDLKQELRTIIGSEWISVRGVRANLRSRKASIIYLRSLLNEMAWAGVIETSLEPLPTREEEVGSNKRNRLTKRYRLRQGNA